MCLIFQNDVRAGSHKSVKACEETLWLSKKLLSNPECAWDSFKRHSTPCHTADPFRFQAVSGWARSIVGIDYKKPKQN